VRIALFAAAIVLDLACAVPASAQNAQSSLAVPLSAAKERALKAKDSFRECDNCPEMIVVTSGSFTMGSPSNETGRESDEGPQHSVTYSRAFAVGKFEVTVDQFAVFVSDTGYDAGSKCWTGDDEDRSRKERSGRSWRNPGFSQSGSHPVTCINWNDAKAYVAWLSRKTGKAYRLLTEAEWEYAARAGTGSRYSFGDSESDLCRNGNGADQTAKMAMIWGNLRPSYESILPFLSCEDGYAYTAPIGSFLANGFGLHDMHGNVLEWVEDCYRDDYVDAPADGSASVNGDCGLRIQRGGKWFAKPNLVRSASRSASLLSTRSDVLGFRVARTLTTP
jgi:formylglycine-generating enzyme required for sulfatase activity